MSHMFVMGGGAVKSHPKDAKNFVWARWEMRVSMYGADAQAILTLLLSAAGLHDSWICLEKRAPNKSQDEASLNDITLLDKDPPALAREVSSCLCRGIGLKSSDRSLGPIHDFLLAEVGVHQVDRMFFVHDAVMPRL